MPKFGPRFSSDVNFDYLEWLFTYFHHCGRALFKPERLKTMDRQSCRFATTAFGRSCPVRTQDMGRPTHYGGAIICWMTSTRVRLLV